MEKQRVKLIHKLKNSSFGNTSLTSTMVCRTRTNCNDLYNVLGDFCHKSGFVAVSPKNHDDVIKWKHFPRYWTFVRGIHRSPVNSPHKDQWRGALMFTLICARINGWVNNRMAGDLRRYRAHYDITVMSWQCDGCLTPSVQDEALFSFSPTPWASFSNMV